MADRGLRVTTVIALLLVAGGVYLWIEFVADDSLDTYGPSMQPTLVGRHEVNVDVAAYAEQPPRPGDIVVLQAPADPTCGDAPQTRAPCASPVAKYSLLRLLKRVVAGPGDSVAFTARGGLIRNGELIDEPYIRPCPGTCALPVPVAVPPRHYFVAGDNRNRSSDSRIWGPIPLEAVDGRVQAPQEVG